MNTCGKRALTCPCLLSVRVVVVVAAAACDPYGCPQAAEAPGRLRAGLRQAQDWLDPTEINEISMANSRKSARHSIPDPLSMPPSPSTQAEHHTKSRGWGLTGGSCAVPPCAQAKTCASS